MIISRTPHRLCLVGGGTDVRDFYRHEYGAVVTCTIGPHLDVTLEPRSDPRIVIFGTIAEESASAEKVCHPLVREALQLTRVTQGLDITVRSEVPEGTGLASSSALAVGLLHALAGLGGAAEADPLYLAARAVAIELDRLGSNAGKLDQYSVAVGGLLHIRFDPDETTICRRIEVSPQIAAALEAQMMLYHTGHTRSASAMMAGWRRNMVESRSVLRRMRDQADEVARLLAAGEVGALGPILDEAWRLKKSIAEGISMPEVDSMYEAAIDAGATGGKLSGAGGGGFMLLLCPPERQAAVRRALAGYHELPVSLDPYGSRIAAQE